jgi:Flp pilus assembly protein TadD
MKKTLLACFSAALLTLCASAAVAGELAPACQALADSSRVCVGEYVTMMTLTVPGHEQDIEDQRRSVEKLNAMLASFSNNPYDEQTRQCKSDKVQASTNNNNMALVALAKHYNRAQADSYMGGCEHTIQAFQNAP